PRGQALGEHKRGLWIARDNSIRHVVRLATGLARRDLLDLLRRQGSLGMGEERELLDLARDSLLARPRELDEALGGVDVQLKPLLARPLGRPLGQLPWLGRLVLAQLAARLLDRLRKARW